MTVDQVALVIIVLVEVAIVTDIVVGVDHQEVVADMVVAAVVDGVDAIQVVVEVDSVVWVEEEGVVAHHVKVMVDSVEVDMAVVPEVVEEEAAAVVAAVTVVMEVIEVLTVHQANQEVVTDNQVPAAVEEDPAVDVDQVATEDL